MWLDYAVGVAYNDRVMPHLVWLECAVGVAVDDGKLVLVACLVVMREWHYTVPVVFHHILSSTSLADLVTFLL